MFTSQGENWFPGFSVSLLFMPEDKEEKRMNGKIRGWMILTVLLAAVFTVGLAHADVEINETNFPDIYFRQYIIDQGYDTSGDGKLSDSELSKVTEIACDGRFISDLSGIQYFTALTELNCADNQLTSLDVSKNTALKKLVCDNNSLESLDVSKNTALLRLSCYMNQLTSVDVSKNTALIELTCFYNQLTSLDVSKNTSLQELACDNNNLTSLDVSKNTALTHLCCMGNKLTSLDVSRNTALKELLCYDNNLSALDVSKNTALTSLNCSYNSISKLDISNCSKLIDLLKNCKPDDQDAYWSFSTALDNLSFDKKTQVIAADWIVEPFGTPKPIATPTPPPAPTVPPTYTDKVGTYKISNGEAAFVKPVKSTASVTVPDTIQVIGQSIPVTAIADKAFQNNKKLTNLTIGKNVRKIGKNACQGCVKLKTVKGGAGVTEILASAFSGCKVLKTFPVMSKLQSIGASVFLNCKQLPKFTLGAKVKAIGKNAFKGCAALKTITVKTAKLTAKNVKAGAFKGIHAKAVFKCSKKQKAAYAKLFRKVGAPKTCVFK